MTKKTFNLITIIYLISILGLSAWNNSFFVFLFLPFIFRPLLRETKKIEEVDERDMLIEYKASHYALIVTLFFIVIYFAYSHFVKNKNPEQEWYLVLFLPIIVKWMFHVGNIKGARKLGLAIGFVFGTLWFLFTVFSHGISIDTLFESVFGLSILLPTLISLKWQKIGGSILMIIGVGLALFFTKAWITNFNSVFNVFLMELILPFPVFFAGLLLLIDSVSDKEENFADLKKVKVE